MPRYNITLSSNQEEIRPITVTTWAPDDQWALKQAPEALSTANTRRQGRPPFNAWEVWVGSTATRSHRTVGVGPRTDGA